MCLIKKQLFFGILGVLLLGLTGCRRYTCITSPHYKRIVLQEVPREKAHCIQSKAGVEIRACLLSKDAVENVFGKNERVVGYAMTVQNQGNVAVCLQQADVCLPLLPYQEVYARLAAHITEYVDHVPLAPAFIVAGIGAVPLWWRIGLCFSADVSIRMFVAGFTVMIAWPLTVAGLWLGYHFISKADYCTYDRATYDTLQRIILQKVTVAPGNSKTVIFFTKKVVDRFAIMLRTNTGEVIGAFTLIIPHK